MHTQSQIDQLKSMIDCRNLIAVFSLLSGEGSEWFGPCPWCGGNDRFHVTAGGWWCRESDGHCGRKGDAIRFIQEYKNLTFPQAVEWLSGQHGAAQSLPFVRPDRKKDAPAIDWRSPEWQALAGKEAADCAARLDKHNGGPYLAGRGIVATTAKAYHLGYNSHGYYGRMADGKHDMRPAITIPWFDGETISCVRYRFLEPDPNGLRYRLGKFPKNATGNAGDMGLFRPPVRRSGTMVIAEGEINAMSIYQATTFDPYATGSESITQAQLDAIRQIAATYNRVLVWMDKADVARKVKAVVAGALAVRSPEDNGVKYDANALLQTGQLAELLAATLSDAPAEPAPALPSCTADVQPDKEGNTPAHRMLALSSVLGFTYEWLPDGRLLFSRPVIDIVRRARPLLAEVY